MAQPTPHRKFHHGDGLAAFDGISFSRGRSGSKEVWGKYALVVMMSLLPRSVSDCFSVPIAHPESFAQAQPLFLFAHTLAQNSLIAFTHSLWLSIFSHPWPPCQNHSNNRRQRRRLAQAWSAVTQRCRRQMWTIRDTSHGRDHNHDDEDDRTNDKSKHKRRHSRNLKPAMHPHSRWPRCQNKPKKLTITLEHR